MKIKKNKLGGRGGVGGGGGVGRGGGRLGVRVDVTEK